MPYVPIPPASRDDLVALAQTRWHALESARPDLKPAVDLQRRLLTLVIDLTAVVGPDRLPRLSLPPKYVAAKLARGVPALAAEPIPLPVPALTPALLQLAAELQAGGAGEVAAHIRAAIAEGGIDAGSLLAASLGRDQHAIRAGAEHRGLAPDLLWLVAELAVSPVAHALQQVVFARADETLGRATDEWSRGYCPACGSWPALAEVVAGRRVLRCSFCALAWELTTHACLYCEEAGDAFVTAAPEGASEPSPRDRRLELCGSCNGYLKAIDAATLTPFPLVAIADLETMDLDVAAMERGYSRPQLHEFRKRQA